MENANSALHVCDQDLKLIRHQAQRGVGRAGLRRGDADDLQQQALLELCTRIRRFDATRSPRRAFVVSIARNAISRVVRDRSRSRRRWDRCGVSLDDELPACPGRPALIATIDSDAHDRRLRGDRLSATARADLRLDVEAVVRRLPPRLREACRLLSSVGPTDAARALGVPRGTYHDMVRQIRAEFHAAGLWAYAAASAGDAA